MMPRVYISCRVLPGQFESEYYVMVNGSAAYYINQSNLIIDVQPQGNEPGRGRVIGYVVEQTADRTLVQLPGEVVIGGVRTWVENADVCAAA